MKRRNSLPTFLLLCLLAVTAAFASCRRVENVVYSDFRSFGSDGWDPLGVLSFSPWPMDSLEDVSDRYDLVLTLRYSPETDTRSIPLQISEEDENGVIATGRLNVRLRNADGSNRGRKTLALYEVSDTLRRGMQLPQGYLVELTSLSPIENTTCLRNIGLRLCLSGQSTRLRRLKL